jgi:hypothetical protein
MTPSRLREIGTLLYGPRCQTDVARDLGFADRTIRRWNTGSHPIPYGIEKKLHALLTARALVLAAMYRKLPLP